MLCVVHCRSFVVRCLLSSACSLLFDVFVRCVLCVVYGVLYGVCCLSSVGRCLVCVVRGSLFLVRCLAFLVSCVDVDGCCL